MTGRMYPEGAAKWSFWLTIIGFNVTFFPQFVLGAQGMPRRYWDYVPEFQLLNRVSTVGSWFLLAGFGWAAIYLWRSMKHGPKASANPWESLTLEWQSPSPPPHMNFTHDPIVNNWPYEYRPRGGVLPVENPYTA